MDTTSLPDDTGTPDTGGNWCDPVEETARKQFGIPYLYPWQRFVIANILDAAGSTYANVSPLDSPYDEDGNERSKQIVLLPTGAGKSLCFLVPAALLPGATLIFYPLLALMSDQARRIRQAGMHYAEFRGGQSETERQAQFDAIRAGAKIILANPEVMQQPSLLAALSRCAISHIVIDEAHCVSEWGGTFRPAYLELGRIAARLNVHTVTAFTATASPAVLAQISRILFDGKAHTVRGDTDRPNIVYAVRRAVSKQKAVLELVLSEKRPVVVFCKTRNRAESTAHMLRSYLSDTAAAAGLPPHGKECIRFYHAGLSKQEKAEAEQWFFNKKDAVLVCTCAFGMGIDKPDIRTVIHLDAPVYPEFFAQESGRAGRDGKQSSSILVWSLADAISFGTAPDGSRERTMYEFAESGTCRRRILVQALGGEPEVCSGCDICNGTADIHAQEEAGTIRFIRKNRRHLNDRQLADCLREKANRIAVQNGRIRYWENSDFSEIIAAVARRYPPGQRVSFRFLQKLHRQHMHRHKRQQDQHTYSDGSSVSEKSPDESPPDSLSPLSPLPASSPLLSDGAATRIF